MSEEEANWYGSNYVNDKEFVRRILWLAHKFNNFKCKFSYFYHSENKVKGLLDELHVNYEIKHGGYYDSYAEDVWDYMILLNLDAKPPPEATALTEAETLTFNTQISEKNIPRMIFEINEANTCYILRTILTHNSNIYMTDKPEELLRDIYNHIYRHYEPTKITLHVFSSDNKFHKYGDPYQVYEITV